jgi:tRNA (guanine6-N2)-methyltransferase
MRVGKKGIIERIYSGFLRSASLVLRKRMVAITSEMRIFEKYAAEHFSTVKRYDVRYGDLMTGVYVVEL